MSETKNTENQEPKTRVVSPKQAFRNFVTENKGKTQKVLPCVLGGSFLAGIAGVAAYHWGKSYTDDGKVHTGGDPKVLLNTEHGIHTKLHDDYSEAFWAARKELGEDGLFNHEGKIYPTMTDNEWNARTPDEKLDYLDKVNWEPQPPKPLEISINDGEGTMVLPMLSEELNIGIAKDTDGDVFYVDSQGNNHYLDNMRIDNYGNILRDDPITGDTELVVVDQILKDINDTGIATTEFIIPDYPAIEEVIVLPEPDPTYHLPAYTEVSQEVVVSTTVDIQINQHEDSNAHLSDRDLLESQLHEIAEEAGISDIRKIKIKEKDDGSFDVKIKGEDGEKLKTSFSEEDIAAMRDRDHDDDSGVSVSVNSKALSSSSDDESSAVAESYVNIEAGGDDVSVHTESYAGSIDSDGDYAGTDQSVDIDVNADDSDVYIDIDQDTYADNGDFNIDNHLDINIDDHSQFNV